MLLRAGISISEALTLMADSSPQSRARIVNGAVLAHIMRGSTLSDAMVVDGAFHRLLTRAVHIGEASGTLAPMLRNIANSFREQEKVKQQMIGAGIYPACIGLATLGVAAFLILCIFPKVMPLFMSMHIKLPLATRVLLEVSHAISAYWWQGGLMLVGVSFGTVWLYRRHVFIQKMFENVLLKLPAVSSLLKQYACSQMFQIMATLMEHGGSTSLAIREAGETASFFAYRQACAVIASAVDRGQTCAKSMREFPKLFSSDIAGLMSIAERSGETATACGYIAEISKGHVDRMLGLVSRLIEPVLMLLMGLIVGSIALSIIMPIYEITNQLTH